MYLINLEFSSFGRLCGFEPFDDLDEEAKYQSILKCDWSFKTPLSESAKVRK